MAKTKEEKIKIVEKLKENLKKEKSLVLVNCNKLKAREIFELREKLKSKGALLQVVKKTLLKIALRTLGKRKIEKEIEKIKEPLALIFSFSDEISGPKVCFNFSKENKDLKILGGLLGEKVLTKKEIEKIAKIPSKEELLKNFLWVLNSPIRKLLMVLSGNLRNFIFLLTEIKKEKGLK